MELSILYRGPLESCNYACAYCPFAKRTESDAELEHDRASLRRFTDWVAAQHADRMGILFTPWGEGLVRRWYRAEIERLSHLKNVRRVAIQTNLSCELEWVARCDRNTLALWATFHPTETPRADFLAQCALLIQNGVRFSAGVVGVREHFDEIAALRRELPAHVYVWINAYKDEPNYYTPDESAFLTQIDPLFPVNLRDHPSAGRSCRAGSSVFSVDGDGVMRRCHFIREPIGNIYAPDWRDALQERVCTNAICGCHIGYVHLRELELYDVFGAGVLERIPAR